MVNASEAMDMAKVPYIIDRSDEVPVFNMGGYDVRNLLQEAVDRGSIESATAEFQDAIVRPEYK